MRLARAYDEAAAPGADSGAGAFKRIATAVGKYWVCKRGPGHAFEALECLGGNGYVEESGLPRLYREMPLSSIWEGSGNVMALALQGSLLVRHAPPAVADASCASRLAGDAGLQYGTLPPAVDTRAIIARHAPPPV